MKDPRYIPKDEFDAIYGRVPRLTVEVIVRTPTGIILTERSMPPGMGQWHIPGGTVYFEESLHDAVKRIALDELGVEVTVGKNLGYIEYPELRSSGYKGWPVGIAFEASIAHGEIQGSNQGERIGYFTSVPDNTIPEQEVFLHKYIFSTSHTK